MGRFKTSKSDHQKCVNKQKVIIRWFHWKVWKDKHNNPLNDRFIVSELTTEVGI